MPQKNETDRGDSLRVAEQFEGFLHTLSTLVRRRDIMRRSRQTYEGDRDLYEAVGLVWQLLYEHYFARYRRQGIAKRIVNLPVGASWRKKPEVSEVGDFDQPTEFEEAWAELLNSRRIWHYMARLDRIATLGEFGVLLIGFDDNRDLEREVGRARSIIYLRPYDQEDAKIVEWVDDTTDERYSLPQMYTIKSTVGEKTEKMRRVHHSRVIHVAEDPWSDDVYGEPALRAVYNDLQNLELVACGSAEMFWRGALPGLLLTAKEDASVIGQAMSTGTRTLEDEIEDYIHKLSRVLRLQGIDAKQLAPAVADPGGHASMLLDLIAAGTGIPKRILMGSERGELASSQDERAWAERVDERRREHCEPSILRPFVDKLIKVGVLPEPRDGYEVTWPDLMAKGDKEQVAVAEGAAKAGKAYTEAIGIEGIIPAKMFQEKYLGWTQEEIDEAAALAQGELEEGEE
jgi:hypothetical protein